MDTKVVLMDANTGPGEWRHGRSHIIGPHGIPYAKKDLAKDANHFQFNHFCVITCVLATHGLSIEIPQN